MQLRNIFEPLVIPLDIGDGADTIEVVRRFLALFPGARVELTHLLGSDVLPFASRLLPDDLEAWREAATRFDVDFRYEAFVVRRENHEEVDPYLKAMRGLGVDVTLDDTVIGTPSSSDFRKNAAFTIVFPTEALIRHIEVLFRYNLNRPWREDPDDPSGSSS